MSTSWRAKSVAANDSTEAAAPHGAAGFSFRARGMPRGMSEQEQENAADSDERRRRTAEPAPTRKRSKQAKQEMSELEEGDPPEKLEDWPGGKAKYLTYGGPDGGESYDDGADLEARPVHPAPPRGRLGHDRGRGGRRPRRVQGRADPRRPERPGRPARPRDGGRGRGGLRRLRPTPTTSDDGLAPRATFTRRATWPVLPAASTAVSRHAQRHALVAAQRAADACLIALRLRAQPHDRAAAGAQRRARARTSVQPREPRRGSVTRQLSVAVSAIRGRARRPTRPLRATRMPSRAARCGRAADAPGAAGPAARRAGRRRTPGTQAPGAPSWSRSTLPPSMRDARRGARRRPRRTRRRSATVSAGRRDRRSRAPARAPASAAAPSQKSRVEVAAGAASAGRGRARRSRR